MFALLLFFKFQIKRFWVKYITELFSPLKSQEKNLKQSYMMREPSHIVRKQGLPLTSHYELCTFPPE